jgi:hypothetical protein
MSLVSLAIAVVLYASAALLADAQREEIKTPDDGKREFTVSGCLVRSGYAGYQVEQARTEAIDGKLLSTQPSPDSVSPKKWIVEGDGTLGRHVGEKVEIVGRSDWRPPPTPSSDEAPDRTPHLEVKTVKVLAPNCAP